MKYETAFDKVWRGLLFYAGFVVAFDVFYVVGRVIGKALGLR